MSIKQNLEKWIAELESDGMCDISDNQVIALIRGYSALEAKCAALAAELKQSQIDAGCYKHGMEASNARLVQVAEVRAGALPAEVMAAIQKVARIRLDLNDFDGDKRGILDCLGEAEESLIEIVNKLAAQLRQEAAQ